MSRHVTFEGLDGKQTVQITVEQFDDMRGELHTLRARVRELEGRLDKIMLICRQAGATLRRGEITCIARAALEGKGDG